MGAPNIPDAGGGVYLSLTDSPERTADPYARPRRDLLIGLLVFISLAETSESGREEAGEGRLSGRQGEMKEPG